MTPPRPSLDRLQRWMQAVVTDPAGVASGVRSSAAQQEIAIAAADFEQVVTRSRNLSAMERLEIYNRAYFARLLDCLREEYSVLAAALGSDLFDEFAVDYLQRSPSTSYTLAELGAKFPAYLVATRPARLPPSPFGRGAGGEGQPATDLLSVDQSSPDWADFIIDLARLERAVNEIFDGPGVEDSPLLSAEELAAIPSDRRPQVRFVPAPCLRLLSFTHPVNDCFTAFRRGEQPDVPVPTASYLAVTRRNYRVVRWPLSAEQYALLAALVAGESLERAIERAAAVTSLSDDALAIALSEWLTTWTAAGFFVGIDYSAVAPTS